MAKSVNKLFFWVMWARIRRSAPSTGGGTMVANFTLATSDRFPGCARQLAGQTEWHNLWRSNELPKLSATT